MIQEDSKAVEIILHDLCEKSNASHTLAIDSTGIPISTYSKTGFFNFEVTNLIASLTAASFEAESEIGAITNYGKLSFSFKLFEEGVIISSLFRSLEDGSIIKKDGVLIVIFFPSTNIEIDNIRCIINECKDKLLPLLDNYSVESHEYDNADLADIFSNESQNWGL